MKYKIKKLLNKIFVCPFIGHYPRLGIFGGEKYYYCQRCSKKFIKPKEIKRAWLIIIKKLYSGVWHEIYK